jgi:ABC-type sulfate transport system permease component
MKLFVLLMLAAIVLSLGSGLFFMTQDGHGSPRMLKALKIRVALSATLIAFLVLSYSMGWIPGVTDVA